MARHRDDRRKVPDAYGRYSGTEQSDERRREERRDHGLYGYGAKDGPGYEREPHAGPDDYYDPDHLYRSRGGHGGRHGNYGKGPKGYRRSDERIREDVCDGLTDDPYIDATDIEVAVKDGEVTLGGSVGDRHAKRHAEEIAEHATGVKHVQNNLRIGPRQFLGS